MLETMREKLCRKTAKNIEHTFEVSENGKKKGKIRTFGDKKFMEYSCNFMLRTL